MAKWNRQVLGSILKGKDGKPNYIKMEKDVVLKEGMFLNLENEAFQLTNLKEGVEAKRVSSELEVKIADGIKKIPWYKKAKSPSEEDTGFVLFKIVKLDKV